MAHERRFSIIAAASLLCLTAAAAWDYGADRLSEFTEALLSVVAWRPSTASESLDLDCIAHEMTATADKRRLPFTAFIERTRNHLRFRGDGFIEPAYSAT